MIRKLKEKIEQMKKKKHNFIENENQEPSPDILGDGGKKVTKKSTKRRSTKLKNGGAKYKDGGFLEGPAPILFED